MKFRRLAGIVFLLLLASVSAISTSSVASASGSHRPPLSHGEFLHNAREKKSGSYTAWGGRATINWTNPNLTQYGWLSYHRVATIDYSAQKYVEFGVAQTSNGIKGLIAWNDGSGDQNAEVTVSAATHSYSHQYDPNTSKYWFYVDGANVYNISANFSSGNISGAGGEAGSGVEQFNSTLISNLSYLKRNSNGTFVYSSWNGHVQYNDPDDAPYYNTDGPNSNSFYDKGP